MEKLSKLDQELKEAREELDRLAEDPEMREVFEAKQRAYRDLITQIESERYYARTEGHAEGRAEGIEEGRAEGRAEGRIEGRAEEKKEIILNLHKMDMPIQDISKAVNLTKEEVQKIIEENK